MLAIDWAVKETCIPFDRIRASVASSEGKRKNPCISKPVGYRSIDYSLDVRCADADTICVLSDAKIDACMQLLGRATDALKRILLVAVVIHFLSKNQRQRANKANLVVLVLCLKK